MSLFGSDSSELDIVVALKDEASASLKNIQGSLDGFGSKLSGMGAVTAEASVAMAAFDAAIISVGKEIISTSAQFEQMQVGFTTLLGSGDKAMNFMSQLKDFAAKTPFEMPGLADMATTLLSVGIEAKNVIPDLKAIGDAASAMGKGQEGADAITHALAVMEARGKLSEREIMMLSYNGINGLQLLSEQTGKTTGELTDMISKGLINGKVAAELFMKAFENKWGDGMEKQALTVNGLMSTLRDNMRFAGAAIGDQFLPQIRELVTWAINAVQAIQLWITNHQELVKIVVETTVALAVIGTVVVGVTGALVAMSIVAAQLGMTLLGFVATISSVVLVIGAIIATVIFLSDTFGGLGNAMKAVGLMAREVGNAILGAMQVALNAVLMVVNSMINFVVAKINFMIDMVDKLGAKLSHIDNVDLKVDVTGFDKMQKDIDQLDQMQADKILADSDAKMKQADANKQVAAAVKLSTAEMQKNLAALTSGVAGTDSATKSTASLATKQKDLQDALQKTQQTAKDNLKQLADDHTKYLTEAGTKIQDLKDQLTDLQTAYNKGLAGDQSNIADSVVAQEQKIADLKKQISTETDAQKLADLQTSLAKEQQSYNDNYAFIQSLGQAYQDAEARAAKTEFQRQIDDYNAKRKQALQDYTDKKADLDAKLLLEQNNAAQELKTYNDKVKQINAALDVANAYQLAQLKGTTAQKIAVINQEIAAYNALADAMNRAAQGKATQLYQAQFPSHEFGGVVQGPEGMPVPIMAHGGEQIIPARQSAQMTGGGSFNITINNPVVRSDDDLKKLDRIFRDLAINYKFKSH